MLKRVISLIVGATCMVSMTGVFAGSYFSTTTTYSGTTDANGKPQIQVTTNVTLDANEVVTYLVYREKNSNGENVTTENLTGADIVYVDQYKNSTTSTETKDFTYVTLASDIGSPIKTGADVTNTQATEVIPGFKFNVVNATDNTLYWGGDSLPTDGFDTLKAFPLTGLTAGDIIESVTVTGLDASGAAVSNDLTNATWFTSDSTEKTLWMTSDYFTSMASATVNITLKSAYATTASIKHAAYFVADAVNDTDDVDSFTDENITDWSSVIVVGTVDGKAKEFGIALGASSDDAKANAADAAKRLKALGKNSNGDYAIRVYDSGNFGDADVYAVAYFVNESGSVVISDVRCIDVIANSAN